MLSLLFVNDDLQHSLRDTSIKTYLLILELNQSLKSNNKENLILMMRLSE